jgi:hypothetical protein
MQRPYIFALIPISIIAVATFFNCLVGDYPPDPEYAYLFNSLNIVNLTSPDHNDHPGVPLQLLGAAIILGLSAVRGVYTNGFHAIDDVLTHPVMYLRTMNVVIACLVGSASFFLGRRIFDRTGKAIIALTGQAFIFMSFAMLSSLTRVCPEPLLMAEALFLAGLLTPFAFEADQSSSTKQPAVLVGITLGLALTTKITSVPLLLTIGLLRNTRDRVLCLAAMAGTTGVLIFPIRHRLEHMMSWFVAVATHRGQYGTGELGIPAMATLKINLAQMIICAPELLVILLGCFVALIILRKFNGRTAEFSSHIFFVGTAMIMVQLALVTKHPGDHYMVPTLAFMSLVIAALGNVLRLHQWRARLGIMTLSAALLCGGVAHVAIRSHAWLNETMNIHRDNQKTFHMVSMSHCAVISYYAATSTEFLLMFGNRFAGSRYSRELSSLYPKAMIYEPLQNRFETFDRIFTADQVDTRLSGEDCVYLVGSPVRRFDRFGIPKERISLVAQTQHDVGAALAVYELKRASDGLFHVAP